MKSPSEQTQWQGILALRSRAEEMAEHENRSAKEALKTASQAYQKIDNTQETCNS